ncbi:MAG: MFS transporter [Promicromonosporaceae bacterium]|nr:MFS transporter [Promicromonosporaceae bacterium]
MPLLPAAPSAVAVRRAKWCVLGVFFVAGVNLATWISRLPAAREALGFTDGQMGVLLLIGFVGTGPAMPLAGVVTARLGTARTVATCAVFALGGYGLLAAGIETATPWLAAVGLACFNAGNGIWDAAMNVEGALVERHLGRSIMPRLHAGFSLGTVVAAAFGGLLAGWDVGFGWHLGSVVIVTTAAALFCVRGFLSANPLDASETVAAALLAADEQSPVAELVEADAAMGVVSTRSLALATQPPGGVDPAEPTLTSSCVSVPPPSACVSVTPPSPCASAPSPSSCASVSESKDPVPAPPKPLPALQSADTATGLRGAASAWRESRTLLLGLVVMAAALTEGAANDWTAMALVDGFETSEGTAAFGLTMFLIGMTVTRFVGTWLVDRFGRVAVLRTGSVAALIGVGLFVFAPWLWLAMTASLIWGAAAALGFPLGMSAASDDPRRAAMRVSVVATIGYSAFFFGPLLIGFLGDHFGTRPALLVIALPIALGLAAASVARPPRHPA